MMACKKITCDALLFHDAMLFSDDISWQEVLNLGCFVSSLWYFMVDDT